MSDLNLSEAINEVVRTFRKVNSFEANISALDNVTPAQWRAQLDRACEHLELVLNGTVLETEQNLHDGVFLNTPIAPR